MKNCHPATQRSLWKALVGFGVKKFTLVGSSLKQGHVPYFFFVTYFLNLTMVMA